MFCCQICAIFRNANVLPTCFFSPPFVYLCFVCLSFIPGSAREIICTYNHWSLWGALYESKTEPSHIEFKFLTPIFFFFFTIIVICTCMYGDTVSLKSSFSVEIIVGLLSQNLKPQMLTKTLGSSFIVENGKKPNKRNTEHLVHLVHGSLLWVLKFPLLLTDFFFLSIQSLLP